ncbi:MAG TPA: dienelactone hydrolase family protein [Bryobacteraceae bacterium]|nr:dienelactone hydrolase family protein [Bryobacteraceae bacterium]
MVQEEIEIPMADGAADAVVYRLEGEGQRTGVLHLTDIGGIRPAYRDMARRLAAEGYVVLMPNVFYRTSRPPVLERKPGDSEEVFWKRFAELTSPLTPEAIASDAAIYVDVLARHPSVLPGSRFGVVGYCYTGAYALRVAAACPERIAAAASFHGGSLVTDAPTSPHLLLPSIQAQLYFGHAVNDRSMPEDAIRKLDAALQEWGGEYESEIYAGASHGWTASDNPAYNAPQADRAFSKLTDLFAAALP